MVTLFLKESLFYDIRKLCTDHVAYLFFKCKKILAYKIGITSLKIISNYNPLTRNRHVLYFHKTSINVKFLLDTQLTNNIQYSIVFI